jgi:hypothetical protein
MKNRIIVLLMLLGLLCFTSMQSANADAGGACLGQWSECRDTCDYEWGDSGWKFPCYDRCDKQRDKCLSPVQGPVN